MPHLPPRLVPMLSLLAILLAPILPAPGAQAQVAPEAMQRGTDAARDFARLVPDGSSAASLPRLSDPRAAPMLNALWNSQAVVAGRPQPEAGTPALQRWGDGAARVLRVYLTAFRAGTTDPAEAERRMAAYQDETTRAFTFLLRLGTTVQQGAQDRIRHLPPAQRQAEQAQIDQGLRRMSLGLAQISQGILVQLGQPGLKLDNARLLATAVAEDLPLFGPSLPAEARQELRQTTARLLPTLRDAGTRAQMERIRQFLAAGG
jgi:hypothetical protein